MARKFLICSSKRSGSHMLASALDTHPDLQVAGEVIVRPGRYGIEDGPVEKIIEQALERYDGFIHHRDIGPDSVWPVLAKVDGLNIISLKRSDMLETFVSSRLALETDVWQVEKGGSNLFNKTKDTWCAGDYEPKSTLEINPNDLKQFFTVTTMLCTTIDWLLVDSGRNLLNIRYEDLVSDWDKNINEILSFLGVTFYPLKTSTAKQETRTLPDVIENFNELRQAMTTSIWGYLFNNRSAEKQGSDSIDRR